jgi:hypothetical protein
MPTRFTFFQHLQKRTEQATNSAYPVYLLAIIALFLCPGLLQANDTIPESTHNANHEKPVVIPPRASLLSATLPGLGQVYNRKYWKVPIIYAGFGALAYYVGHNSREYQKFRAAYIARIDGNPNTIDDFPLYSKDVLERAVNFYRRNLEVTYLLGAALYLLNILDANVDAHLMDFDVGEKLSFSATPPLLNDVPGGMISTPVAGLSFRYRF